MSIYLLHSNCYQNLKDLQNIVSFPYQVIKIYIWDNKMCVSFTWHIYDVRFKMLNYEVEGHFRLNKSFFLSNPGKENFVIRILMFETFMFNDKLYMILLERAVNHQKHLIRPFLLYLFLFNEVKFKKRLRIGNFMRYHSTVEQILG